MCLHTKAPPFFMVKKSDFIVDYYLIRDEVRLRKAKSAKNLTTVDFLMKKLHYEKFAMVCLKNPDMLYLFCTKHVCEGVHREGRVIMAQMTPNASKKLPMRVKICYGFGGAANMIISMLTTSLFLYFCTEALGLSGSLSGLISMVLMVWGCIWNPFFGAVLDRTPDRKGGKCRTFIKYTTVPSGVILVLCFVIPDMPVLATIVWLVIVNFLRRTLTTVTQLPLTTLMGRMTSDKVERSHLNQIYTILATAGSYLALGITMPLITRLGGGNVRQGFVLVSILYGIVFVLLYMAVYWGTKGYEPEGVVQANTQTAAEKPSIAEIFKGLLVNKFCLLAVALYLVDLVGVSFESYTMSFYFQYNMGNPDLYAIYSAISLGASMLSYVVVGAFVKRFGNARTAFLGALLATAGYGVRFLFQDAFLPQWIACLFVEIFGAGLVASVSILCVYDTAVYGEWKTGVNSEGLLMAAYGLTSTIGLSVGQFLSGVLLDIVPYASGVAVQEASVLQMFLIENTLIPCVGFVLVAVIAVILMQYEKKIPQFQAEIAARKEKEQHEIL